MGLTEAVVIEHQRPEDGGAVGHLVGGDDSGVDGHIANYTTRQTRLQVLRECVGAAS
jgi:hypothetical protein